MNTSLQIAGVFSDHAVLQRDIPLRVWGWADPGMNVTVTIAGKTAESAAGSDGRWTVTLPPFSAGGPHALTVRGGDRTLRLTDIMIGEVWLCAGQSNMECFVTGMEQADKEIADAASWPGLRLLAVPRVGQATPAEDRPGMAWQVCSPDTVPTFSALGFCFGRRLNRELGIAIGLINTAVGGTLAETWCTRESLMEHRKLRELVDRVVNPPPEITAARKEWQAQMDELMARIKDPGNDGWRKGWADPDASDHDWTAIDLPAHWQGAGFDFSGVLWFRKEIDIPATWAGKPLQLCIGACDKSDTTYFNNAEVGSIRIEDQPDAWCVGREYLVPGGLVTAGRNVIAVRVYSHMYAGGMTGPAAAMHVALANAADSEAIPLNGKWRCMVERNFGKTTPPPAPQGLVAGDLNAACALYCGTIAPLVPYGMRGVIWYQGEGNVGDGPIYLDKMKALIGGWRAAWQRAFPFYFVQLSPARYSEDDQEMLPLIWEAQMDAMAVPNTGMAVTTDLGNYPDVHNVNKEEVGRRLALWALAKTYGRTDLVHSGPLYKSMVIEGDKIRLQFNHAGGGLVTRDSKAPDWFTIAGDDRKFVPAEAVIDGNSVVVNSAAVPKPVAVRFAWRQDAVPNLINREGLPAPAFRTDR